MIKITTLSGDGLDWMRQPRPVLAADLPEIAVAAEALGYRFSDNGRGQYDLTFRYWLTRPASRPADAGEEFTPAFVGHQFFKTVEEVIAFLDAQRGKVVDFRRREVGTL